ncbi:hypothetical protein ACWGKQ_01640 [Streptomyces sp. NPDC054770]
MGVRQGQVEGDGPVEALPVPQDDAAGAGPVREGHHAAHKPDVRSERESRDTAQHPVRHLRLQFGQARLVPLHRVLRHIRFNASGHLLTPWQKAVITPNLSS